MPCLTRGCDLTKAGDEPGVIDPHAQTTGNLAEWVDWDTPTLE